MLIEAVVFLDCLFLTVRNLRTYKIHKTKENNPTY